jgi:hypothetical protein
VKTWIIDNGGEWSEHEIIFVYTDAPDELVLRCVQMQRHTVMAVVDGPLEWRVSGATRMLTQYVPLDTMRNLRARREPLPAESRAWIVSRAA